MTAARISLTEAAARLGIHTTLAAQAIEEGKWSFLGAHKIGERTYVIPRAPFERWVDDGQMPGVVTIQITVSREATPDETVRAIFEQALRALPVTSGR